MIDYKEFVSKEKSLLIAPAGYGKTHTIAECLKYIDGTQLILTHTHAGVASLKEKIKKIGILLLYTNGALIKLISKAICMYFIYSIQPLY